MPTASTSYYEFMLMNRHRAKSSKPTPPPSHAIGSISNYEFMMMNRSKARSPHPIPPFHNTQIPSSIRDVFLSWKKILVDSGLFGPSSNVIISLDEDEFPQSGTAYALLCPLSFVPDNGSVNGGGRYCTIIDGLFWVIVRTRNRMNLAYQDSYIISNADNTGIFWLADQVIDKLHLCFPEDVNGDLLVAEPPRLRNYAKASRAGTQSEWTGIKMLWDVSIQFRFPTQIP
jgi:hypothetical protein